MDLLTEHPFVICNEFPSLRTHVTVSHRSTSTHLIFYSFQTFISAVTNFDLSPINHPSANVNTASRQWNKDIRSLISKSCWGLLKLKRSRSTLIHCEFPYSVYVFLLSSYCRILIHIYFPTVLSGKQIPSTFLLDIEHGWLRNNLYIWKLTCLCVFLNKWEVLSRFFV